MEKQKSDSRKTIKQLRQLLGLTQAQAAASIGYTASYFALIEREPRLLTSQLAHRLAVLFSVPVGELYSDRVYSDVQRIISE